MAKYKWYAFRWQIGILFFLTIILLTGKVGYRLYRVTHKLSTGSGPAGPGIPKEPFKNVWTKRKIVFVGLGDSITYGLGAPSEHSYFQLLQKNDDAVHGDMKGRDLSHVLPNLEAFNYAVNYSTTQDHIEKQLPQMKVWPDDVFGVVVITSGGNDLIHDYGRSEPKDGALYGCSYNQAKIWTDNIAERLRIILDNVIEKFPGGCEIFLANIYDPTDSVSDTYLAGFPSWPEGSRIVELTNSKIEKLCRSYDKVHLVDVHSEFLGHGIHCTEWWRKHYRKEDPTYWYFSNFEDPNPRGYDAIRRLFLLKIIEAFNDASLKDLHQ